MEDAITFIQSPNASRVKDDTGIEANDDTVTPLLSPLILRSSHLQIPPKEFVNTVQSMSVQRCHNLMFLLWALNSQPADVELSLAFSECEAPFQLFKECFGASKDLNYESFLKIRGSHTKSSLSRKTPSYEVAVFPQILQNTKLDQFRTDRLLSQYTQQFARILESYTLRGYPHKSAYLSANMSRLLQCYVNDTIYDIFYKWRHWNRIVGHQVRFSPFSQLVAKFWDAYMVFQVDGSLPQFATRISHISHQPDSPDRNLRSRHTIAAGVAIKYGIWIDTVNGVLLLCNTLTTELMDVIPSLGLNLTVDDSEQNVKKLLLFVNCCLLECITQELTNDP
ncbi:LANO_0A04874g1_1 [Lachancea nothofagi CBS 11611]|uniref:LANO_0A04874g1_1 n=1 Tax=Lachancea nothofagi CBS 11611 TaxID=1266666 RepID=A0A1G4IQN7_9SACH|nr:LANO_0A04874g1_1 [Lachancea nothofagi CBS 11611]